MTTPAKRPTRPPRGFHLVDLLIALAILAILLAIALPSYQGYQLRAERANAVRQLVQAAQCQEVIRGQTGSYDIDACMSQLQSRTYRFDVRPPSGGTGIGNVMEYTISATPLEAWPGDPCGALSLDQAGSRTVGREGADLLDCWGGR